MTDAPGGTREVVCPSCGAAGSAPDDLLRVRCPDCGDVFDVEVSDASGEPDVAVEPVGSEESGDDAPPSRTPRRRAPLVAAGVLGIVVVGAVVWAVASRSGDDPPSGATAPRSTTTTTAPLPAGGVRMCFSGAPSVNLIYKLGDAELVTRNGVTGPGCVEGRAEGATGAVQFFAQNAGTTGVVRCRLEAAGYPAVEATARAVGDLANCSGQA